jgi:hypothetical protein
VKRRVGTFVMLLLISVVCVSAIPQPDQPETSYNEVDTPVNQAPPVVPGVKFERPSVVPIQLPKAIGEPVHPGISPEQNWTSPDRPAHLETPSFHSLLCTFLI